MSQNPKTRSHTLNCVVLNFPLFFRNNFTKRSEDSAQETSDTLLLQLVNNMKKFISKSLNYIFCVIH